MRFENTEVWGFEHAIRGMRNPKESWSRSDSYYASKLNSNLSNNSNEVLFKEVVKTFVFGNADMELAQKLIAAGNEHRKFLRQIFVSVDITAPLYWWKEMDTYKINTTSNSTSTMHMICKKPIDISDFEIDDLKILDSDGVGISTENINYIIDLVESLRLKYLETHDKSYWKELIRWLPESYLQTRTMTMNYENIRNMVHQRQDHRLNEWSGKDNCFLPNFIAWTKSLPYARELIFFKN